MGWRRARWSSRGHCSMRFVRSFAHATLPPTGHGAADTLAPFSRVLTYHRGGTHSCRASTTPMTMLSRVLPVVSLSLLVACGPADPRRGDAGGTLIITVGAEPDAILPITTTTLAG